MTLATTAHITRLAGNGVTRAFSYGYKVVAAVDLQVRVVTAAGAVSTPTVDITLTPDPTSNPPPYSAVATFAVGQEPASGSTVVLWRQPARTQEIDFGSEADPLRTLNIYADRTAGILQDLYNTALRAPQWSTSSVDTTLPVPVAGGYLAWNSTATALINAGGSTTTAIASAWLPVVQANSLGDGLTAAGFSANAQTLIGRTFAQMRSDLSLGTAALVNTGTSGATAALCNGANVWGAKQTFGSAGAGAVYAQVQENCYLQLGSGSNRKLWLGAVGGTVGGYVYNSADVFESTALSWDLQTRAFGFDGVIYPITDNARNFGSSSNRFKDIYATNATIQTSDQREKTPLSPIPDSVKRAVRSIMRGIGVFQWLSAIAEKGDGARLHVGVTAQAVRDAFLAEGEDPTRWGVFCEDILFDTVEVAEVVEFEGKETIARRVEHRMRIGDDDLPVTRLGVRHSQLMMLALASLDWS